MMKVLGCTAVVVIRAEMIVDQILPERNLLRVAETQSGKGNFSIYVPRRLQKEINIHNTLVVLCIPDKKLSTASETMAVARKEGNLTTTLWAQNKFWADEFTKLL